MLGVFGRANARDFRACDKACTPLRRPSC
jgi:hypothetical protein